MSDVQATPENDPLAADKAALAAAQEQLAKDQAQHDADQAALDQATAAHAADHERLTADQAALAAAQEQLAKDQAVLNQTAQPASTPAVAPEAETHLQEMEDIALKWGGDIGTDLRNLVGKLKSVLGLDKSGS